MRMRVFTLVLFCACATEKVAEAPQPAGPSPEEQAKQQADAQLKAEAEARAKLPVPPGLDEQAMDPTANPCDDFYQYACGGWVKTTEIPADRPLYSRGFVAILDRNEAVERQILEDAAAGKLPATRPSPSNWATTTPRAWTSRSWRKRCPSCRS